MLQQQEESICNFAELWAALENQGAMEIQRTIAQHGWTFYSCYQEQNKNSYDHTSYQISHWNWMPPAPSLSFQQQVLLDYRILGILVKLIKSCPHIGISFQKARLHSSKSKRLYITYWDQIPKSYRNGENEMINRSKQIFLMYKYQGLE